MMSYESSSNSGGSSTGGILATVLTIVVIVGGIGLKVGARALRNSNRNSSYSSSTQGPSSTSSSSSSWGWGRSSGTSWNDVVAYFDQCSQEVVQDYMEQQSKYQAYRSWPAHERQAFAFRCQEKDNRVRAKISEAQKNHGNAPRRIAPRLQVEPVFPPWPQSDSESYEAERLAQQQQREVQQQQREAATAEANARLEQQRAEQEAQRQQRQAEEDAQRQIRLAEQQARDQELRNRLANLGNGPAPAPQPFVPPQPIAPLQQPAVEETPGFAVTAITQVKPRDIVFVKAEDKWIPALVQAKRGLITQIRYTTNGVVEMVTLDRIRLQNEPVVKAESDVPAALRVVGQAKPQSSNREPEDDALFVAKPNKEPPAVESPEAAPPPTDQPAAKPAGDSPTADGMRIWSDDTGEFKVEAELLTFEFDLVQLKRHDGKVLTLRIEKLSTADQALVREKFR